MNIDLRLGDCIEVLKTIPDDSIDSIVTDPPYGLEFMGKKWDYDVPSVDIWRECLRILKPGGHLLSFAGSRTYHRMAVRIEDAGFEIRDQIMYIYGSGFPKSHNIGKALDKIINEKERAEQNTEHNLRCVPNSNLQETELIDKEQGQTLLYSLSEQDISSSEHPTSNVWGKESILERGNNSQETEGKLQGSKIHQMSEGVFGDGEERWIHNGTQVGNGTTSQEITNENGSSPSHRPQSSKQQNRKSNVISEQLTSQEIREIRKRFDGFGTALKPAHEPIVLARKPLSEKSIAENVLKHGTGGINIDGSRIGTTDKDYFITNKEKSNFDGNTYGFKDYEEMYKRGGGDINGRFPANIIFDEEAGKLLDEQSGISKGNKPSKRNKEHRYSQDWGHRVHEGMPIIGYDDLGGASRFFYCPKASKKDRNEGLDNFEDRPSQLNSGGIGRQISVEKRLETNGQNAPTTKNNHPTVKPTDLMRYLINLVTPKGGTTLDPFMGSGSTGKAAVRCAVNFIGIEKEEEYMKIAEARINHERNKPRQQELF